MLYDCLIVDDEELLAETTCEYLNLFDVKTAFVISAQQCEAFLQSNEVKLILLDINLGQTSGFELCKKLRQTTDIPILFVSARSSEDDILIALNIGGDDYIHKPYTLSVLLAKIKVVLKRYGTQEPSSSMLSFGNVRIDTELNRAYVDNKEIKLKLLEFKLLLYLVKNKNKVVTKEEIFQNVWKDSFTTDGTLNVHIRHLREKIEHNPNQPQYIKTIWGIGYALEDQSL